MRFLIDENVRKDVISFLKSTGQDIIITPSGLEDYEIAKIAKREARIILTHDHHFADILQYPPEGYSGIIRIKIHPPTFQSITDALTNIFNKLSFEDINKKLIILEKDGFRIR